MSKPAHRDGYDTATFIAVSGYGHIVFYLKLRFGKQRFVCSCDISYVQIVLSALVIGPRLVIAASFRYAIAALESLIANLCQRTSFEDISVYTLTGNFR